ncbi:MAG: 4Fe-4S dicluster domain-containing protein [Desulfobacteraceae bacterium]|nr:MAG: 4Fe-4S dicluster domain-containing protein [Desulfobacteraceae bacterium]
MFHTILLYIALALFGIGLIYKVAGWFRFSIGIHDPSITTSVRILDALQGWIAVLSGPKLLTLIRVFITDVLFQNHIRKQDVSRWAMHMLINAGFAFLLFMHALDKIITTSLFEKYYLAVNPYLLVSGSMVIAGIAIAVYRRLVAKAPHLKTNSMDAYLLILLAVILLSGFVLESTKLTSYTHYQKIWDIHFLACLVGLAYLPFSKMFHILATPVSLLTNAVMDKDSGPANIKTRQVMELDACMHCGNCSKRCSVAVASDIIGNVNILPSERMAFLKEYIKRNEIDAQGLAAIQQGIYLCTNCDRCTVICPAGINLRELWFNVREEVIQRGHPVSLMLTPFSFFRGLNRQNLDHEQYDQPLRKAQKAVSAPFELLGKPDATVRLTRANSEFKKTAGLSGRTGTYSFCFSCENCSTVCPVVGAHEDPQQALDLLPHQIVRSMGLGLKDLAMGSRMLWYCLTCYQCQEHCPQGVKVTDIFYELKNLAATEASCSSARNGSAARADG